MVVLFNGHSNTEVAGRQYVLPLQREHQKHVCRPNSDALDLGQVLDDLFIRHLWQASEIEFATNGALRHVAQVGRLLLREAYRTHLFSGKLRDTFRSDRRTSESRKSLEDGYRSFPIQLLINDGLSQTMKHWLAEFHPAGPDVFNDSSEDWI